MQEDSLHTESEYWFPAKHYGWGWGFPVLARLASIYRVHFAPCSWCLLFPPRKALFEYLIYVAVLSVALIGVCWLKGEPPRWRWGDN
jgi:hypothetical protein